jgi:hypothetical protein
MIWPADTPPWLKVAVEDIDETADRQITTDEPARACGFKAAVIQFKEAINAAAESQESKRLKELHDLTWGPDGKPAS